MEAQRGGRDSRRSNRDGGAFLGQSQNLGTPTPGKRAGVLVLGADPVASIAAFGQIEIPRRPRLALLDKKRTLGVRS